MPALNFQKQFADDVASGKKRQTIRAVRKDHRKPAKAGDMLALYTGMRTKGCRKLREVICTSIEGISIRDDHIGFVNLCFLISRPRDLANFARADGFADWTEMVAWFEETHGLPFHGWLIKWDGPVYNMSNARTLLKSLAENDEDVSDIVPDELGEPDGE